MHRLTKNFNFIENYISKSDDICQLIVRLEQQFVESNGNDLDSYFAIQAGKIVEQVFTLKMGRPRGESLNDLIRWYNEIYNRPIVTDAMHIVRKWRNSEAHARGNQQGEKLTWTNALYVLKSVSIILQDLYEPSPNYEFVHTPYMKEPKSDKEKFSPLSIRDDELKIEKSSLINWLTNPNIVFKIPFYQRDYAWKKSQIDTLWEDIKARVEDGGHHYFGVIAIVEEKNNNNHQEIFKIIDGQQRLTTTILFFKAAYDNILRRKLGKIKLLDEIFETKGSLMNNVEIRFLNEMAWKGQRDEFNKIIKNSGTHSLNSSEWNYGKNYQLIYDRLNKMEFDAIDNFIGVFAAKFEVGKIAFNIENDREMDIFQSLNSKGTDLKEWDLIKNHLFSVTEGVSDQEKLNVLNKKFLYDFSSQFIESNNTDKRLDEFCTEYFYLISLKFTGIKWKQNERFALFKNIKFLLSERYGLKMTEENYFEVIEEFKKFGKIFGTIQGKTVNFASLISDLTPINTRLKYIAEKQQLNFLIFKAFDKFCAWDKKQSRWNLIDKDGLFKFVKLLSNIVLRIEITKGLGTSFRTHAEKIGAYLEDNVEDWYHKMKFYIQESELLNVNDYEVENSLISRAIKRDLATFLLLLTNDFLIDETKSPTITINFDKPSLEHVMPKKPNEWWEKFLQTQKGDKWKEYHERYLDRIGNFYVLPKSLNSKNSNLGFQIKKEEITKIKTPEILGSNLHGLTPLEKISDWSFEQIEKRTKEITDFLIKKILKI